MTAEDICAVVVTFHPSKDVFDNLIQLRSQFRNVIVVDNGSPKLRLNDLRNASQELGFELIVNEANLGVATALNIGVRRSDERGYQAVVLFDQDSTLTDGFLAEMLAKYELEPRQETVAIVSPRHLDRNTQKWASPRLAPDGSLLECITSGSMMPLRVFTQCGWFEDDFIIDMVDTEYCLRARSRGFRILLAEKAGLLHSVGAQRSHSLLGIKEYRASHHSAPRRYYMTRNRLVMLFRYWRFERALAFRIPKSIVMDTVIIALFEKQRLRKIAYTLRGIVDALRGRMGKAVELS